MLYFFFLLFDGFFCRIEYLVGQITNQSIKRYLIDQRNYRVCVHVWKRKDLTKLPTLNAIACTLFASNGFFSVPHRKQQQQNKYWEKKPTLTWNGFLIKTPWNPISDLNMKLSVCKLRPSKLCSVREKKLQLDTRHTCINRVYRQLSERVNSISDEKTRK